MPIQKVNIGAFLSLSLSFPVFDVRSPSEFAYAHIPGALSLPLFTDEQRKEIGTAYKQVSRESAIKIGLTYFGPQLNHYLNEVEKALAQKTEKKVLVHCWRGGMRSSAMAWLLSFCGYEVILLEGGYKAYRNEVLQHLQLPFSFYVLGGFTGSGKTEVLHALKKQQIPTIDLEHLAAHKGSAFGALGMQEQPSQEQFENLLIQALTPYYQLTEDGKLMQPQPIWIENESQRIGLVNLPKPFYQTLQNGRLLVLDIPFAERINYIAKHYGKFEQRDLVAAVLRIQKKLGGLDTKTVINLLLEKNILDAFTILLQYYDKQYLESSERIQRKKEQIFCPIIDAPKNAAALLYYLTERPYEHGN